MLSHNGVNFRDGDEVIATIQGKGIEGIYYYGQYFTGYCHYILHDDDKFPGTFPDGIRPNTLQSYSKSRGWMFYEIGSQQVTDVRLIEKLPEPETSLFDDLQKILND